MRLTLRTLLAYLDDVLDPADKEELAHKIETSDFARDLVHKSRDSVRRLRLSAPQVIGTGMGMDPNTVAEYLDNALPPEQVGDYERICLESDVHLAETAACHHVLTMVLGEPAEVEPRSRQRMYMIPAEARERRRLRTEPAHARGASAATVSSLAPGHESPMAARPQAQPQAPNAMEIPEYLRTPWWQSGSAFAALAAVLLVGTAVYFVTDMRGWFGGAPDVAAVSADEKVPPKVAEAGSVAAVPAVEPVAAPGEPTTAAPAVVPTTEPPASTPETSATAPAPAAPPQLVLPALGPPQTGATADMPAASESPATVDADVTQSSGTEQVVAPSNESAGTESPASTPSAAVELTPPVATEAPPLAPPSNDQPQTAAMPEASIETVPPETPPTLESPPIDTVANNEEPASAALPLAPADVGTDADEGAAVPQGPPDLGTYLGGKTVLLRFDPSKGGWFRVEPRSAVVAGEQLLSLPEFRPSIALASGLTLDLSGGTHVVLTAGVGAGGAAADEASVATPTIPTIDVSSGRIVLTNPTSSECRVRLQAGAQSGEARIGPSATLGFEVKRTFVTGSDPRATPTLPVAKLFSPHGGVTWTDASGELVVEKPSWWTLAEGTPSVLEADASPPDWLDSEPKTHKSEQRFGTRVIDGTLVSDRPVDIQLLELFKGRDQPEVKSLVTRSAIEVGLFAPFIDSLRDPAQKWPTWRTHIEAARSAMAQNPQSAELVFKALVDQRGRPAAAELYEMLCGYSAEQIGTTPDEIKTGAVAQLIDWLEEDSLDYRVLAVYDLWDITRKQLMPNPAANATVRKRNVRDWRNRLASGDLEHVQQTE